MPNILLKGRVNVSTVVYPCFYSVISGLRTRSKAKSDDIAQTSCVSFDHDLLARRSAGDELAAVWFVCDA